MTPKKTSHADTCEGCDGSGIRPFADNNKFIAPPNGFVVVERCDICERFDNDLAAAKAFGTSAIWQAADDDVLQLQAICIPPARTEGRNA